MQDNLKQRTERQKEDDQCSKEATTYSLLEQQVNLHLGRAVFYLYNMEL